MIEVRCKECNKLLGWFDGKGSIKCPRHDCGCLNDFDTNKSQQKVRKNTSLKNRTTSSGVTFG